MKGMMICAAVAITVNATAQDSAYNKPRQENLWTFSGYVEPYYSYDLNRPPDNNRPAFIYNYDRHNEFNLNLGYIKGSYTAEKVRGNLAFAAGTYMNANYANEPGVLKNIYEANAGFKIGKKNLWLDAGIFPSHIGFESATGKDNWTLTRSMLAENSPYYEAGAKLSYTSQDSKWMLSALALNGWQRIQRVGGNSLISFGSQVLFRPNEKLTVNYSTFIGTDKPDSLRQMRTYHNVYGVFQVSEQFGLTAGIDLGTEGERSAGQGANNWYACVLIAKCSITRKWSLTGRGEYYKDTNQLIIATGTLNGFNTTGLSLNVDYAPANNMLFRVEGRMLKSKDDIFIKDNTMIDGNSTITTSFALSF